MPIDLNEAKMPNHVAIIMDGNGRWAEKHGLPVEQGHEAGALSLRTTIYAARDIGLKALTLYAFSTENWSRPQNEVLALFHLMSKYARLEIDSINKRDIRMTVTGRYTQLHPQVTEDLNYCIEKTKNNQSMILNIAVNYGGRAEIADAARAVASEVVEGKLALENIDEEQVAKHLYVPELPELDLLIRTSGEMRVSNFMLWQLSYAEIVSMPVLWPDFRRRHLQRAVAIYQSRRRRFGGRS